MAKSAPLLSPQRSRGLHPLLVPPLRGLRTTSGFVKFSNLEQVRIWNFTNPRERYMLCLDKHTAEKPTQKFILFFLPDLFFANAH